MLNEEYSSDTSDEDFIPDGIESDEEDEDGTVYDDALNENNETDGLEEGNKGKKRKKKCGKQMKKKTKKGNPLLQEFTKQESDTDKTEVEPEKDDIVEDNKASNLWADFLADVDEKPKEETKPKCKNAWTTLLNNKNNSSPIAHTSSASIAHKPSDKQNLSKPVTVKITKVFEFAGEEVKVEEEVPADCAEAKAASLGTKNILNHDSVSGPKKQIGLSGILSHLDNKAKKLSTLEKTKLDWMTFKSSEGIGDELQTHLKSKSGYLEKQEFLDRADKREFEIERSLRMGRKTNR